MSDDRPRRSELVAPGSERKFLVSAAASSADSICIDLEDGVAPNAKSDARELTAEVLRTLDWQGKRCGVRVNQVGSDAFYDDLDVLVQAPSSSLDAIVLPKVNSVADVYVAESYLGRVERSAGRLIPLKIDLMIETVPGLLAIEKLRSASVRVESLLLGSGDLAIETGARVFGRSPGTEEEKDRQKSHSRHRVLLAARSAGLVAMDGPSFSALSDTEWLAREVRQASLMGFDGKWILHPSHIRIVNDGFALTPEEESWALQVLADYKASAERGVGAARGADDRVIDHASVALAQRLLRRRKA